MAMKRPFDWYGLLHSMPQTKYRNNAVTRQRNQNHKQFFFPEAVVKTKNLYRNLYANFNPFFMNMWLVCEFARYPASMRFFLRTLKMLSGFRLSVSN